MEKFTRIQIEEGFDIVEVTTELMPGVKLVKYEGTTDGVLVIGDQEILFRYDSEAKQLFERVKDCKAAELLAILARK